jgi:hypothetical protein
MIIHCRHRSAAAFEAYRRALRMGVMFPAYKARDWDRFVKEYLEAKTATLPRLIVRPSGPTLLDTLFK